MLDTIVKIFIAVILVGGIAWGIWFENAPSSKDKEIRKLEGKETENSKAGSKEENQDTKS